MSQVIVRDDRVPDLDGALAELVGFWPPFRQRLPNGTRYGCDSLRVDVRVIETGDIWFAVWASRCTPRTRLARDLIAAHGRGCPRVNRRSRTP
jgi:hypothetical protein